MRDKKTLKIVLEGTAKAAVEGMIEELQKEGEYSKLSPSRLAAWIILHFERKDFAKYREKILANHFNPRKYLNKLVSGVGESDDLEKILRETLQDIKSGKKGKKKSGDGLSGEELDVATHNPSSDQS